MKITCNRSVLADALAKIAPAIPGRTNNEVWRNAHLKSDGDGTVLMAFDGEVSIAIKLDVTHEDLDREGVLLLPHARLSQIARMSADEVLSVAVDKKDSTKAIVKCGGGEWTLQMDDPATYAGPKLESVTPHVNFPAKDLIAAFAKVVFCCDVASTRYALGGVCMTALAGRLELAATDSRRLGISTITTSVNASASNPVVPAKGARAVMVSLAESEEVIISWSQNLCVFETPSATVTTRLVEGRFPNYRSILPESHLHELTIPRLPLLSALRQASIVTNNESRGLDLCFGPDEIRIRGLGADIGKAEVRVPISGMSDELLITLDPAFVIEALKVMHEDSVYLRFNSPDTPFVIMEPNCTHVIMPLAGE